MTRFLSFSEAAIQYTEKDLRTLGWDPVENSWGIDDLIESQSIVGQRVDLVCGEEVFNEKTRLKVKFINPLGGGMVIKDRLDEAEAKSFTSALRQRLGVTGGAKKRPAPKAKPVTAAVVEDDIPF